jgi:hypothetical protein
MDMKMEWMRDAADWMAGCRGAAVGAIALMQASGALGALYTNDTDWGHADWTLADGDVVGGVHTNVGHLSVPSGATVTVQPYDATATNMGRVAIFAASGSIAGTLSADSAGNLPGTGVGKGTVTSSTSSSGAGYGGRGGVGTRGMPGDTYGDWQTPVDLGSGGGHIASYGPGGSGGGAIRLHATGQLDVDGTVSAAGGTGYSRSSGGSGGSIWITAASLTGTGTLQADGGPAANLSYGGGGGGGRIAIDAAVNSFAGMIRAKGMPGSLAPARNGTYNVADGGALVISNDIALPPTPQWSFQSLTLRAGARLEVQSVPGTAAELYTNEVSSRILLTGTLTVENGATLAADGLGYLHNAGPGAGINESGAGHGGLGGIGYYGIAGGVYGSSIAPTNLGSGGAKGRYTGGPGGGALIVTAGGTATVNGTLTANGADSNDRGGGGSGGSIWITAPTIVGSGTITADGGVPADRGGGGGGGRIAFTTSNNAFTGILRARGAAGLADYCPARNGTFSFPTNAPALDLVVSHDIAIPASTNWVFRSLTVTNGARLEVQSLLGSAAEGYTNDMASLIRVVNDITIYAGATVTADGLGYPENQGEGRGGRGSYGDGGGGGYGGCGGLPNSSTGGDSYGRADQPERIGSGGGNSNSEQQGGCGGGAVLLTAGGRISVEGNITAHGGWGNYRSGGGSGGSIWLKASEITGGGVVAADGGKGIGDSAAVVRGSGGGGGRIALQTPVNSFNGVIRAKGHPSGAHRGHHGTYAFSPDAGKDLVIAHDIALPPGTNWVFRSLTVTNGATLEIQSVPGTAALTYTNEVASRLVLIEDLIVASNATLSANSLGYRYMSGPGAGTVGNNGGAGASHGGLGGAGAAGTVKAAYGDPLIPNLLGSGGAGNGGTPQYGGSGGGALILAAGGSLVVEGALTAHGGDANPGTAASTTSRAGGGSGGSVWLVAPVIAGHGAIGANGGKGATPSSTEGGGGGAGGRILLAYGRVDDLERRAKDAIVTESKPANLAHDGPVTVAGATGFTPGEAGTVRYLYMPPPTGTLFLVR